MGIKFINSFLNAVSQLVVNGTATYQSSAGATSHTINLPSGIVVGELLVVVIGKGTATNANITIPSGWTSVINESQTAALHIIKRVADGSEGSTLNITCAQSCGMASIVYRMSGYNTGTNTAIGTAVSASTTTPNPPSLTPSWGAARNMWLAIAVRRSTGNLTAYPTNYTENQNALVGSAGGSTIRLWVAGRFNNVATEDPGTFTIDSAQTTRSNTFAVRPA